MKFGLRYCNTGRYVDPAQSIALMRAAKAAGFESAWAVEHTAIPRPWRSPSACRTTSPGFPISPPPVEGAA
jgi:alkanesulfonate monooxygenase SsuD/methylene tetrahydromethanopterin reductase-like flavin-dependent oxidoreductase (luciferase family)